MITAVHKTSAIEDDQWERVNLLYVASTREQYAANGITRFYSETKSQNKNLYSESYIERINSTASNSSTIYKKSSVTNYTAADNTNKL